MEHHDHCPRLAHNHRIAWSLSTPSNPLSVIMEFPTPAISVASPEDAFSQLWSKALRKCEQSMPGGPSLWTSLLYRMDSCREAEDVCQVLDETMRAFERFRGSDTAWGKLRDGYLKPAIEVLLLFNDAVSGTAAGFVCSFYSYAQSCPDNGPASHTRWRGDVRRVRRSSPGRYVSSSIARHVLTTRLFRQPRVSARIAKRLLYSSRS